MVTGRDGDGRCSAGHARSFSGDPQNFERTRLAAGQPECLKRAEEWTKRAINELLGALDWRPFRGGVQVLTSDSFTNPVEEVVGDLIKEPLDEAVIEAEVFRHALADERMVALFNMLENGDDGVVEFKECGGFRSLQSDGRHGRVEPNCQLGTSHV